MIALSCEKEEFNPDSFIGLYDCEVKSRVPVVENEYLLLKDTVYQDTVEVIKNDGGQLVINFSTLQGETENNYWLMQHERVWNNSKFFNVKFNSDSINIWHNGCNCSWNYSSFNGKKIE